MKAWDTAARRMIPIVLTCSNRFSFDLKEEFGCEPLVKTARLNALKVHVSLTNIRGSWTPLLRTKSFAEFLKPVQASEFKRNPGNQQ